MRGEVECERWEVGCEVGGGMLEAVCNEGCRM